MLAFDSDSVESQAEMSVSPLHDKMTAVHEDVVIQQGVEAFQSVRTCRDLSHPEDIFVVTDNDVTVEWARVQRHDLRLNYLITDDSCHCFWITANLLETFFRGDLAIADLSKTQAH